MFKLFGLLFEFFKLFFILWLFRMPLFLISQSVIYSLQFVFYLIIF